MRALSQSPDWAVAAKELEAQLLPMPALNLGNAWLALIYVSDHLAKDISSILIYLK
jgi:hypothetical protein